MICPTIYHLHALLHRSLLFFKQSLGKVSSFATSLVRILIPLTTFCVSLTGILWSMLFNSDMHIKYDRTCQRSIKIISMEKTFALHKSAQKKHFYLEFFFKESSWLALFHHLKIANFEKLWFFTLDDTLTNYS